ncbi:PASTA domain-containing protein [Micromonospora cathayae]|uniref:PASTA domain-containing protein n=1 Tax=Micromonospora cathayae TaxID=3028804 RepID=A0ABY7ZSU7_9ACTN|nr:PASTA domain-containing protein [Micromonospora sp. HUAS 3]WDZ86072.1 PASTA domain-containing protein [Micromonospora sp. HUAS 3]
MSDDRREPGTGEDPEDRTRPVPRPESPTEAGSADRDGAAPVAEGTRVGPPVPTVWSGRAEVPAPRSSRYQEAAPGEWYPEVQDDRRWWLPIVVASVALVFLAVLGVGLWLIVRSTSGPEPAGTPSPPAATTGAAPTPSPSRTTPTTPPPTTTGPDRVPMPPLVGLPQPAAEAVLDRLGLGYRVELRPSDRPAGTVIEIDPPAGESVPAGSDVTLVVSEGPAVSEEPTESTPATPAPTPTPTG